MMDNSVLKKLLAVVGVVILVVIAYSVAAVNKVNNSPLPKQVFLQSPTAQPTPLYTPGNFMVYNCEKGKTAFDLLKLYSNDLDFKQSSFGKMVTRINNMSQANGKYWMYSIDDKEATVSADAYNCKGAETVKWELK